MPTLVADEEDLIHEMESEAHPSLRLTPAVCCLCGIEDVDPVGVGEDFEYRTSTDTFLTVRCRRCGMLFLNPRPAESEAERIYPAHYHAFEFRPESFGFVYRVRQRLEARRLKKWCRGLPANARILDVGCGDGFHLRVLKDYGRTGWQLEGIDRDSRAVELARQQGLNVRCGTVEEANLPPGAYRLVLMVMTIEHVAEPETVLNAVAKLLAPGGRVVIVTDNALSPDARLFGGRHWGGYHFPRHFYLFSRPTLRMLGERAGLVTERISTAFSPVNWVYSLRNLLDDWGAPRWMVNRFTLKSPLSLALFTLLDIPLSLLGRGAILQATFRREGTTS